MTGDAVLSFIRLILLAAVMLALGCARPIDLSNTDRPESEFATLVDSHAARRLLADLLAHHSLDPRVAALSTKPRVTGTGEVQDMRASRLPDQAQLRELGVEVSMDFAALAFAQALLADPRSRGVQAAFDRFLQAGVDRSMAALQRPRALPYTLLFAPSWLYRSHPETGSDFAHQRRLLDQLGIPNRLIASGESDSVEDNASVIVAAVRSTGREKGPVILVSASKSGAEAALALSQLAPEEAAGVAAWVNIAGALRGTPLADSALIPPAKWLARGIFWLSRWDWAGLSSLATEPSRRRLAALQLSDTITVVNVVAVPVSGSVSYQVYPGYQVLVSHGPNDGVVLLADTVWPGGVNLVALGADHLFARQREDAYSLALLRAVDVAVRFYGPSPQPSVAGELDGE
jgi:hypothetical protein